MEEYLYGRYTTLRKLAATRDDYTKPYFVRERAAKTIESIQSQLKDQKLNSLRERLIKATKAGDEHEAWKIENLIREHTGQEVEIET